MAANRVKPDPKTRRPEDRPTRVLIVDDSGPDALITARMLSRASLPTESRSVALYDEALFLLSSGQFDVALVDHDLGLRTGVQLIQMARSHGVSCPMILVTGSCDPTLEASALELGASDFISKDELCGRALARVIRYGLQRTREAQKLVTLQRRFEAVIAGSNDGIWDWSIGTGEIYLSPRFLESIGAADCRSLSAWMKLVHDDDRASLNGALRDHAVGRTESIDVEYRVILPDGTCRWLYLRGRAQRCENGRLERIAGSQTDITERREREEVVRRRAHHDPLTKLANRAHLDDRLAEAITASRRNGGGFSLLYFDLDRFKQVNDEYGHAAGDEVLRVVGSRIRESVSKGDCVARIGGDEFVVLLDGCVDEGDAQAVGARVEALILQAIPTAVGDVDVGVSWGAHVVDAWEDPESLLDAADRAMYAAKRGGNAPSEG
ncbi:MAG: diguanylate cyclase domain-containing protein [Nannocystaceae bacterium]|nr:diguanylate cyclase [bacterium]